MEITSLGFLCFLAAVTAVYYLVPRRGQWGVLLGASLIFAAGYDMRALIFILLTAFSIRQAALAMGRCGPEAGKKRKRLLQLTLLLNVGILGVLKYLAPFLRQQNLLPGFRLLIPLGLSYYTLQALSYVLDVYWGRQKPERSFGKLLLFTCYFPQMLQGPISRYQGLGGELFEKEHRFSVRTLRHGAELMLWGFFKTLVIGEQLLPVVSRIFEQPAYGVTALAGLGSFAIALYCNFSGGIDIVRGVSALFGVELTENFRQPYFSRSLGEFWRRWHISLGEWMKNYVFYPLSLSRPMAKLKKRLKKRVSRKMVNKIVIALANLPVFLLVGVWHGFGTNFALWGLYNGLVLAFSEVMTEPYRRAKEALHIRSESPAWQIFSVLRTFFVVILGLATDCAATAPAALLLAGRAFLFHRTDWGVLGTEWFPLLRLGLGLGLLLAVSIVHEKGISIREKLDGLPFWLRAVLWILLIQMIACLGQNRTGGGFIYANF